MAKLRPRLDANQKAIINGLRKAGVSIQSMAGIGCGCADILAGSNGHNYIFEIKNPNQPPSKQRLTEMEQKWHVQWRGRVHIITGLNDALKIMGLV